MKFEARHLGAALFVSLGVNLFLGGLMVGDWMRSRALATPATITGVGDAPPGEASPRGALQRMLAAVPDAQRPDVERRLAAQRHDIQRAARQMREARERVARLMAADRFDRGEIERAHAEQREHAQAVQVAIQKAMIEAIADLPPETRRAIVAAASSPGSRR